jgi:hypothetical protein
MIESKTGRCDASSGRIIVVSWPRLDTGYGTAGVCLALLAPRLAGIIYLVVQHQRSTSDAEVGMPRLSVYVPDDLWDRARQVSADPSASAVVQAGLQALVASEATRPVFAAPPPDSPGIADLRMRLSREGKDEYERAYRAGIELAAKLPFRELDKLSALGWNLLRWVRSTEDERTWHDNQEWRAQPNDASGSAIVAVVNAGYEDLSIWRAGVNDALRDIWISVTQGAEEEVNGRPNEGG